MIDLDRIVAETFLREADWYEEISSTNNRALELATHPALPVPYLVGATTQSAGRGRGSNSWWAAEGTLMFSVVLDMSALELSQSDWPRFSLGTALSIAETIESFLPSAAVGVKWPNDVWLGRRKVCGILIEQPEKAVGKLVVGIGLNVNARFDAAPDELRAIATSMLEESGQQFPLDDVLIQLLRRWQFNIDAQRAGRWDLRRHWSRLCVLTGAQVRLSAPTGDIQGTCQGIAEDGALLILDGGKTLSCYAGTVRRLS